MDVTLTLLQNQCLHRIQRKMRVSHTHQFVFLSNPKCGSTTIRQLLSPYSDLSERPGSLPPFHAHTTAAEMQQLFRQENWDWSKYFVFTTIRNPWARVVSYFHYGRWDEDGFPFWHKDHDKSRASRMSFDQWLVNWRAWQIPNWQFNRQPLEKFAGDENGELLVDLVLPIEKCDQLLPGVLERLGIPDKPQSGNEGHPRYQRLNSSTKSARPYQEFYDDRTRKIVETIFRKDIDVGNYTF